MIKPEGATFSRTREIPLQLSDREEVLRAAKAAIIGQRQRDYGSPEENFRTIAAYWSVYLSQTYGLEQPLAPVDVALMMSLMKVARAGATPTHKDSYVDMAGYAGCAYEVAIAEEDGE